MENALCKLHEFYYAGVDIQESPENWDAPGSVLATAALAVVLGACVWGSVCGVLFCLVSGQCPRGPQICRMGLAELIVLVLTRK